MSNFLYKGRSFSSLAEIRSTFSDLIFPDSLTGFELEKLGITVATVEKSAKEKAKEEIFMLKAELASYDYIGTKIAFGVATRDEYAKEIAYTETLRERIRKLEPVVEEK